MCEAEMMIRLVGEPEPVRAVLEQWVAGRAELDWGSYTPVQRLGSVDGFKTKPFAYTTDAPLLTNWGRPFLFGPGSITVAHTPDEFIDLDELRAAVGHYERLVRSLLAG
jgi:acetylornithine deacetylase